MRNREDGKDRGPDTEYLCWKCLLLLLQVFFNLRKASLQHFLHQLPLVLRPRPGELTAPSVRGLQSLLLALRFFGATVVLFIPTFLMGGSLPILVRGITRNSAELSIRVSQLYWVNTLGAVAGTLISGFVVLPALGLQVTVASAVALNIPAGLIALRIAKELSNPQDVKASPSIVTSAIAEPQQPTFAFLLFLFAVVGGTAFAYEIAWTRLLAITISSFTYALTLMLATFLTGTVIGSAFFRHYFASSGRVSLTTFSRTQTLIGIAALTSLVLDRLRESTPNESRISKAFIYDIQF